MRLLRLTALAAGLAVPVLPAGVIKDLHVRIRMRDGVYLAANIFRPDGAGRVPAILVRTPYGKGRDITPHYLAFVNRGYAVVAQDVRGRYESEGVFEPLSQEPQDGDDTIDWIARQPWCDGKIGMMGGSYLGIAQWKVALLNNPHLKAIFPVVSGSDDYRDRFYSSGGALKLGQRLLWMSENLGIQGYRPDFSRYVLHLPLRTSDVSATGRRSDMFQEALDHPAYDSFWRSISTRDRLSRIRIPVFIVGGWYDNFVESDLEAFAALRRHSGVHRILIGPWPHNMSIPFPGVDFGPDARVPVRRLQLEWFDQWLKGKDSALLSDAPARVFLMGANRWLKLQEWPPPNLRFVALYMESRGHANSLAGDGSLSHRVPGHGRPDRYVFDPRLPVPTRGGAVCCNPKVFPWGPMDQRGVERRSDVLVYTSAPLKSDLEVTGTVRVVLYAATSARDTDFTAKLVDVFADGTARNLTDGILRLRYRESLEKPALAIPGEVYRLTIDAGPTANLFRKGHRIRVEISSSNFPRFDRNPNNGEAIASETRMAKAFQVIYHDPHHPSHVVLPVLP